MPARVTCDDRPTVYADGVYVGRNEDDFHWSGELADDITLLAVQCTNNEKIGGFLASVGDVLISDSTWKCSDTLVDNWYGMDFDDDDWSNAYVLSDALFYDFRDELGFEDYVQWLWYNENNHEVTTVYCRGRTGKLRPIHLGVLI